MKLSFERQRLVIIILSLLWCVVFLLYSVYFYADGLALGLLWNLFLAALPLAFGAAFHSFIDYRKWIFAGLFFVLWLLFLPNSHYILTDLIHIKKRPESQLWFKLVLILFCAAAGALMGYVSLMNVQGVIEKLWGKRIGWLFAISALMLCGFGIYVGRFLRWNSWDLLTNPLHLIRNTLPFFVDPAPHPHPITVTLICGAGLILGYLALRVSGTSTNE
jgi:uncharacterized membrane protein